MIESNIDSSITTAILNNDLSALELAAEGLDDSVEKRPLIDIKLKDRIVSLLADKATRDTLLAIVTFTFEVARKDLCSKSLPIGLLSDIFEATPIQQCEKMFEFVESHLNDWKSKDYDPYRNHILRLCNDLLRRLSCTTDTVFCGRILILLARYLPLMEKSGLNANSQFNVDNVTKYDLTDTTLDSSAEKVDKKPVAAVDSAMEEGEMDDNNDSFVMVDHNLYCKFWQLQSYFASPLTCYDKFGWKKFAHNTTEVLSVFASHKLEDDGPDRKKPKLDPQSTEQISAPFVGFDPNSDSAAVTNEPYFAKYLTSPKLLQLQLSDNNFRRYVLVQFLILFQYLTADVRFKDKKLHSLNEDQLKFVIEHRDKCYDLLKQTYPGGPTFANAIKHILDREEWWNQWKNSNCEDFTKKVEPDRLIKFRRRVRERYEDNPLNMGNAFLTKLWTSCPDNYDACKASERQFIPELETFLEQPIEELDPESGIEDKYKLINDENFQWRALRLMALKSPCFYSLQRSMDGTAKFLEKVLINTAKDFPKYAEIVSRIEKHKAEKAANDAARSKQLVNGAFRESRDGDAPGALEDGESQSQHQSEISITDNLLSETQISALAPLIGSEWPKLLGHIKVTIPEESVEKLKKSPAEKACSVLLNMWCATEANLATVKNFRNLLLSAELFNEDVAVVLQKSDDNDVGSVRSEVTGGESADDRLTPLLDEDVS